MHPLADRLEAVTRQRPDRLSPLSGGCVGEVFLAHMPSGPDLVVKLSDEDQGLAIEGRMLEYLATQTDLPVPHVFFSADDILVMEALQTGGGLNADVQRHAASIVAALHNHTTDQGYGFAFDTVIGGLHQPNPWTPRWRDFFAEHRLLYMGAQAQQAGRLPGPLLTRLDKFAGALDRWIVEPVQPSLIHGDMWTGNVLCANGRITGFIDPALYFADPEIELAFTTLFGTFTTSFFQTYNELRPIRPGFFEERRDIYNLYPLLVHVRLFGGSYVSSVERTLAHFGY